MPPSVEIGFAADHPTAAGHFPSDPIVPGALLLDEVARVTGATAIRAAKFFHPLRPGEAMRVEWQETGGHSVKFACHRIAGDILLASGVVETGAVPA